MQGLRQSARPYAVTYAIILEVVEFYNVQDRQVNQSMFKPLFVRHPGVFFWWKHITKTCAENIKDAWQQTVVHISRYANGLILCFALWFHC